MVIQNATAASISGLRAAERRLEVSANNIANFRSTTTLEEGESQDRPFQPSQVLQVSESPVGTKTLTSPLDPATIPSFEPDNFAADENGIVDVPNVDFAREAVNQIQAKQAFHANLNTLERSKETFERILNIIT